MKSMTTISLPPFKRIEQSRSLIPGACIAFSLAAAVLVASLMTFKSKASGAVSSEGLLADKSRAIDSNDLDKMSPHSSDLVSSGRRVVYKQADTTDVSSRRHQRYSAHLVGADGKTSPLSVRRWAEILSEDGSGQAADDLTSIMNESPYEAVYFETRPVSSGTASRRHFHFVLVDAPDLKQFCESNGPDAYTFAEHLRCTPKEDTCCSFWNLGGDARLIAPRTLDGADDKTEYAHLAAFLRGASSGQIRELWRKTAKEYLRVIDDRRGSKVYLSTSGAGVSWLHMRLDQRPKYYTYRPFRIEEDKPDEGSFL